LVKVRLQERAPTAGGGVEFIDIGEVVEKTITINPPAIDTEGLRIAGFKPASVDPRGKADCYTETDLSGDIVNLPDPQKDGCAKAMFDSERRVYKRSVIHQTNPFISYQYEVSILFGA
jgi:hypothetical protein